MSYHSYRLVILFAITLYSTVGLSQQPETTTGNERLLQLLKLPANQMKADVWKLSKQERENVIREYKSSVLESTPRSSVQKRLVLLGDREAVEQQVADMVSDPIHSHRNLGLSGNPHVIRAVAPHLYRDEAYSETPGDVITPPLSFVASSIAIHVLADSSAFNGDVISWARKIKNASPVDRRAELRRWWKENETFFEREEYLSVNPGNDIPAARAPIREATAPAAKVQEGPTVSKAVAQPQSDANDPHLVFYIAGGIFTLLLAAFFFMARGRRGTTK